jgi:hypothetical protein
VPQGHPESGQELACAERLGHVVVRAGVERVHLVLLASPRRHDHDRRAHPRAEPAHDLEPVEVGEPEIEQDRVGRPRGGLEEGGTPRVHREDTVAGLQEHRGEQAAHGGLVLDHQHQRSG